MSRIKRAMKVGVLLVASTLVCATGLRASAQASNNPPVVAASAQSTANIVRDHNTLELDGPWRFQVGDDPRSADVTLDESAWVTISMSKPLTEQGIDSYNGYGWYVSSSIRRSLHASGRAEGLDLFVTGARSVGQFAVYVNGVELGRTEGMTISPPCMRRLRWWCIFRRQARADARDRDPQLGREQRHDRAGPGRSR